MAEKELHYYEPAKGHGLRHDPFNAIVAPRPIGWISSRDTKGNVNLAPYSFFNAFCYTPPIIGFSSTNWKDSVANIEETKEFCWNLATMDLARQMNATAAHVARDVDEFAIAGLTAAPSRLVNVPRVGESPVSFECRLSQIIQLQGADGKKAGALLTLGEVVAVHIDRPSSRTASTRPHSHTRSCGRGGAAIISRSGLRTCSKCCGRISAACAVHLTSPDGRGGRSSWPPSGPEPGAKCPVIAAVT